MIAPRLRGGSPTALPQRWGQRINRSSFTLKAVMLRKASTAWMYIRKLNLIRSFLPLPRCYRPACCHSFWSRQQERRITLLLPLSLLLLPHPSRTAPGGCTLFTQAHNWGMLRELNLGAEALAKSMARGGCLGSGRGRD